MTHSQDTTLNSKYLPLIEENCKIGESRYDLYAILFDRNLLLKNLPQKFGTQFKLIDDSSRIFRIYKFGNFDTMNFNRQRIGMKPILDTTYSFKLRL